MRHAGLPTQRLASAACLNFESAMGRTTPTVDVTSSHFWDEVVAARRQFKAATGQTIESVMD
jgi:hypothetical protein